MLLDGAVHATVPEVAAEEVSIGPRVAASCGWVWLAHARDGIERALRDYMQYESTISSAVQCIVVSFPILHCVYSGGHNTSRPINARAIHKALNALKRRYGDLVERFGDDEEPRAVWSA